MTAQNKDKKEDWKVEMADGCGCAAVLVAAGIAIFLLTVSYHIDEIIKLVDKALK